MRKALRGFWAQVGADDLVFAAGLVVLCASVAHWSGAVAGVILGVVLMLVAIWPILWMRKR
jgi:hypothetical protein